tara:strand:+ start:2741 stop:4372 length:1632 start_codon:yes stop_codon:yes gene_type:complete
MTEIKALSARVKTALTKKVEDHNEKYGDDPRKRATLGMLGAVFKRGIGAYRTNPGSVRPSVSSEDQWAYARVNAFLYALKNLKFRGGKFDLDLLPRAHPLSSKKSFKGLYDDLNFTIPKGAKEEAKRGLEWRKEYGRGGTSVGVNSARYIANNTTAGAEKVRHIAKYFPRHEVDKRAEGWRQGEDGYPSNGRIAWALWGGEAGKVWSQKLVRAMNKRDEKAQSAKELIRRKQLLRKENSEYRTNRFRSEEVKDILYKEHDRFVSNWEVVLKEVYFDLLQTQDMKIFQLLNRYAPEELGTNGIINQAIDRNMDKWKAAIYDYYIAIANDFAYYEVDLLLPDLSKEINKVSIEKAKRDKDDILTQGFFLRLVDPSKFPLSNLRSNNDATAYISSLIDEMIPNMARTSKSRFQNAYLKSLDEAIKLNYTGSRLQNYVADQVRKVLSKKNLTRALTIARTETNKVANYGRTVGAKSTGLLYTKEWISQRDGVVRDAHIILDGTEIDENSLFDYDGMKLDYPGDSSLGATPDMTVNCRCFLNYNEKRI